ncbi:MAG: GNAT family N-acetyltransferase, partial [bacterium]|nr:GNAT family N-acetyltransferase [bacterium]
MSTRLRRAEESDLPSLNALCMRSKAVWGYDPAFMEACRDELTLLPRDLIMSSIAVIEADGGLLGMVQVDAVDDEAVLLKLFVEPGALRRGFGAMLFEWAVSEARRLGANRMVIEADPDAAPFYRRMGAIDTG